MAHGNGTLCDGLEKFLAGDPIWPDWSAHFTITLNAGDAPNFNMAPFTAEDRIYFLPHDILEKFHISGQMVARLMEAVKEGRRLKLIGPDRETTEEIANLVYPKKGERPN